MEKTIKRKYVKIILMNVFLFILLLSIYEGYMYVLVRSPKLLEMCPRKIQNSIGHLYAGDTEVLFNLHLNAPYTIKDLDIH